MNSLSPKTSHSEYAQDIGVIVEREVKETKSTSDVSTLSFVKSESNLMYNEEVILRQNGYQRIRKLCDTQQGELIEAITIEPEGKTDDNCEKVIIKKVSCELHDNQTADAKYSGDGMTHCIPKNVVKEALLLYHLTIDNKSSCNYIVKMIHFFHCDAFYYVVLEHMGNDTMNLKEFVEKSHDYIRNGKLNMKHYVKVIKFIFWQIFVLIHWMHKDMRCCHLDLKLEHILLKRAHFTMDKKANKVSINQNISIKVCDFGSAELFKDDAFKCDKKESPLDEIQYKSPQILNEQTYDAQAADIWALGMMFAHCVIGHPLYQNVHDAGFASLQQETFKRYLNVCGLKRYLKKNVLDLIQNMLKMDEEKRYSIIDVLEHKLFEGYYSKYRARIEAKSKAQKYKLVQDSDNLKDFPFYTRSFQKFGFV